MFWSADDFYPIDTVYFVTSTTLPLRFLYFDLQAKDCEKVKATARELLTTLKAQKLALDWRKKQQARADVRVTIEKHLDAGLPRAYTPDLFQQKTAAVFQHVYASYFGAGKSVYEAA